MRTYDFKDRTEVKNAVEAEGLSYFLQQYTSADSMPDIELSVAFTDAVNALDKFMALLDTRAKPAGRAVLAFKVWTADDKWTDADINNLAKELDMRQHYVKTGLPTLNKYKKMIDDQVLMVLDKVMHLPKNWQEQLITPDGIPTHDGLAVYTNEAGEHGVVKRIVTEKYHFDIDEMRMPENRAKFPSPEELGLALVAYITPADPELSSHCRPDSKGFYYLSNVEAYISMNAYMVELVLYMYVVDFGVKP